MKKRIALIVLGAALLAAAVGCDLYTGISVTWTIDTVTPGVGNTAHVAYTVRNVGQYDLTGVNLEVAVDTGAGYYFTGWTSGFSLNKGETQHRTIDVPTDGFAPLRATVLSIDMDKPA